VPELRGDEPDLRLGDYGDGVMELQVRLYGLGYYRSLPDGTFNMHTENAVREMQYALGQDNDGMVTRSTWEGVLYLEGQYGIQYLYTSPYDALDQIIYDLQHPQASFAVGQLSDDGQWQWDGYDWQALPQVSSHSGQLSEDGQWRWDGSAWQPAVGDGYAGQLSPDGQWRWDGYQWQPA
jgi:peptidoglycan hydrolase-like protein with peptidoglycan-binding domain